MDVFLSFFQKNRRWLDPAIVFFIGFFLARWFWPNLSFIDGDSFYHIKITELLSRGIPRSFPWLPFTSFGLPYTDHHLLYHFILYPFILLLDPFVGAKLATGLLAAGVLTVFFIIVRSLGFVAPGFFTALLAFMPAFFFRMNLTKAPAFSAAILLIGLYCIIKRKYVLLAIVSFLFVWSHAAWLLLPFIGMIWILGRGTLEWLLVDPPRKFRTWGELILKPEHRALIIAIALGCLLGLIINPYFPENIIFYWIQAIKIGLVNYQSTLSVGSEWHPTDFTYLVATNGLTALVFVGAVLLFLREAKRTADTQGIVPKTLMLDAFGIIAVASVFFVLTLKSRRGIDYFAPLLILATAAFATLGKPSLKLLVSEIRSWFRPWTRWYLVPAIAIAVLRLLLSQTVFFFAHHQAIARGNSPAYFEGAGTWMRNHVAPGSVIFHTEWDTFPELLMANDSLHYINGLDPTFLYDRDKIRYQLWNDIVTGTYPGEVISPIIQTFQSEVVLIDKNRDHGILENQLSLSLRALRAYEDDVSIIFLLTK